MQLVLVQITKRGLISKVLIVLSDLCFIICTRNELRYKTKSGGRHDECGGQRTTSTTILPLRECGPSVGRIRLRMTLEPLLHSGPQSEDRV